ncbi:hypothetical protein CPB84DRAFT_1796765 [Gymnopilus junonius]|uniref:Uncharacterized protein n=1 Tax=Gymnopilus junonius TaxID=109634 RepID=A0A9P5NAU9_GYMJU|nr:hypothetical protein CPB84DRAFT_1796765 [Gymnopilus junonius]
MGITSNCCFAAAYVGCPIHAFQTIAQNLSEPLLIPFFLSFCLLSHLFRRCFPCCSLRRLLETFFIFLFLFIFFGYHRILFGKSCM